MSSASIITSAAVYFSARPDNAVLLPWLERARGVFSEHKLSPIFFTANGGEFSYDDCYVLAGPGGDLNRFGEVIAARGNELIEALQVGKIESISLDSPRAGADDRNDWSATVSIHPSTGEFYVGVDEQLVPNAADLLRCAFDITRGLLSVGYGIAYRLPSTQYPDGYASGFVKTSYSKVRDRIRRGQEWRCQGKSPERIWFNEIRGRQRHLTGLFRGAYPANILSAPHVRNLGPTARRIGTLTKLDDEQWLWELSAFEIPRAGKALHDEGLLVS